MMRNHVFTAGGTVSATIRRCRAGLLVGLTILIAGPVHAQTSGTIPVWVDPPTQTLGDSSLVQCGDGTSICIGPGGNPAIGQSSRLMGFTDSAQVNDSAVYGEATSPTGITTGVVGVTQSGDDGATGVFGWAAAGGLVGLTTGVWGRSTSLDGRGVVGEGYFGVYGIGRFYGLYGNGGTYGVEGTSSVVGASGRTTGQGVTAIGVLGVAGGPGSYAAEFQGPVHFYSGLGSGGSSACLDSDNVLSRCSSSLRYKTEVQPFAGGLDIVKRLRPIAFTWKKGGAQDVGLAAEEVEQVEPLLTFRNDQGEIEGVKYNQLSAVFVNAFVEQQAQIQRQQDQIRQQQEQITVQRQELEALKALMCRSQPTADVCR